MQPHISSPEPPEHLFDLDFCPPPIKKTQAFPTFQPSRTQQVHDTNRGTSGKKIERKEDGRFSFMRAVSVLCHRLTSLELLTSGREDGYYFVPEKKGNSARLLRSDEKVPENALRLKHKTVGRRADVFPEMSTERSRPVTISSEVSSKPKTPEFPPQKPQAPQVKQIAQTAVTRALDVTVSKALDAEKPSFNPERDTVSSVTKLSAGDQIFVLFDEKSELYAITVKNGSSELNGHRAALVEVKYRVKTPQGNFARRAEGILYLPLAVNKEMFFSENGALVPELNQFINTILFKPYSEQKRQ